MHSLDASERQKTHRRRIETVIYEVAADTIVVEGTLEDRRFCDSHMITGEIRPPYTVHHMIVRLELRLPELAVTDIEVEMPRVPHPACSEIRQCLAPVKGMRISGGFIARVRKLVDRRRGCTHLMALLTAMAPAAFQGAWSTRIKNPLDREIYLEMMRRLNGTCWAWREDGPLVERLNTLSKGPESD